MPRCCTCCGDGSIPWNSQSAAMQRSSPVSRDDERAPGLRRPDASLAKTCYGDAAEAVRPVSLRMSDLLRRRMRGGDRADPGSRQIRFIERERFDERGEIGKDGVDLAGDSTVNFEAWRHEHEFRALSHGRCRRHGRVHTVGPGLVARCGHHASFDTVSNSDGARPRRPGLSRCSTDA